VFTKDRFELVSFDIRGKGFSSFETVRDRSGSSGVSDSRWLTLGLKRRLTVNQNDALENEISDRSTRYVEK